MTDKIKKPTPSCPICREPFVDDDGKFRVCWDCPYRDPAGDDCEDDAQEVNPDQSDTMDNKVTVTLNVAALFRHMVEQEILIRELRIEIANLHFKQAGPERNSDDEA